MRVATRKKMQRKGRRRHAKKRKMKSGKKGNLA